MVQFILDIDWMSTQEFCEAYNIPMPQFTGEVQSSAKQFLQVDAIKHKVFVEYAKFLNKEISVDMFEGDKPIFEGFLVQSEDNWVRFYNGVRVYSPKPDFWSYVFRQGVRPIRIESLIDKIEFYNEY